MRRSSDRTTDGSGCLRYAPTVLAFAFAAAPPSCVSDVSERSRTTVLKGPYNDTEEIAKKLLIIWFLAKFERNTISLESVLTILDRIKNEFSLDEGMIQKIGEAIQIQAVVRYIKKSCFEEASKILRTHITKADDQKLLSAVIRERNCSHPDLRFYMYSEFKIKMMAFVDRLIDNREPFLLLTAKKSISNSALEVTKMQEEKSNQCSSNPEDKCRICSKRVKAEPSLICSRTALHTAFNILFNSSMGTPTVFEKLDKLDFKIPEGNKEVPRRKRQRIETDGTRVSRFVIEPDSEVETSEISVQSGSGPKTPEISVQSGSGLKTPEIPVQSGRRHFQHCQVYSPGSSNDSSSPVERLSKETGTLQGKRSNLRELQMVENKEEWSDEEFLFAIPQATSHGRTSPTESTFSISSRRQRWTVEESEWIKRGVRKFGVGNWGKILKSYPFCDRTNVMIKDRWRTMHKLGLI
ncbi:telomeric repeat binding factor a isoform X2 [Callorhinchus milii]|uniref:telomeric repeat binding factor a isoform X2 n=1 Tax=Callorhinchus milii TaxID=7868 RepID=UPI001C3FDB47|nr:telomeric repeat binding factor a isoform X2 [Callorhinchus milii]